MNAALRERKIVETNHSFLWNPAPHVTDHNVTHFLNRNVQSCGHITIFGSAIGNAAILEANNVSSMKASRMLAVSHYVGVNVVPKIRTYLSCKKERQR